MSDPEDLPGRLRAALAPHGLAPRGVSVFGDDGQGPDLGNGLRAAAVVLVGHGGGTLWPVFRAWQERQADHGGSDPLDAWSKAVVAPIAAAFSATAFFPSDPPYQPFQQWAMRAEGLRASPLGILIDPVYGLWHGFRAALAFATWEGAASAWPQQLHPCENCIEKPCLTRCPADAVSIDRFDVPACRSHLSTDAGAAGCMQSGCVARLACPVGAGYAYGHDQARFHMRALMRLI